MEKKILINNKELRFKLKRSRRAHNVRLAVHCDASVVVTLPHWANENTALHFIREKSAWIFSRLDYFLSRPKPAVDLRTGTKDEYLKNKKAALLIIQERLKYFNAIYKLKYDKITIRRQKTRWGSCSRRGNLSFNYKTIFLLPELADYIVVHELCHLKEFNHSKKFWDLVAIAVPEYKKLIRKLKY